MPARTNRYSVPIRLIGKRVRVVLHASHLVVYDQDVEVARHERLIAKGAVRLDLDHYLEVLVRKPGAFPGSTALEQARSAGRFTASGPPKTFRRRSCQSSSTCRARSPSSCAPPSWTMSSGPRSTRG
ncbi:MULTISPECIES: Mu transposase domain-containing protein [unclassified Streptomyces]|uniref:Mu transposase domain-containing protein n=1 Tax=unclassified Streptomyces TaxID=2593676 RepID=UPI00352F05F5